MVSFLQTSASTRRGETNQIVKCIRNNMMQGLFMVSVGLSLLHTGRHLMNTGRYLSAAESVSYPFDPAFRRLDIVSKEDVLQRNNSSELNINVVPTAGEEKQLHNEMEQLSGTNNSTLATTTHTDPKTWALVTPPGLLGGYRNQVIRLFGMVIGASQQNVKHFLLPSILWTTEPSINSMNEPRTKAVPMEDLFDIEHWNSFRGTLPEMVEEINGGDCWYGNVETIRSDNSALITKLQNRSSVDAPLTQRILQKPRFLKPIANISLAYATGEMELNPRRFDVSKQVEHCTHPIAYGGGGGRGVLWVNYMDYNRKRYKDFKTGFVQPDPLERSFLQALRPHPKWRTLAQQCVRDSTQQQQSPQYIALHPRIEVEMMAHSCGTYMNKNLTKILEDVQQFVQQDKNNNMLGIFVALSRAGASVTEGHAYRRFRQNINENIQTLNRVLGDSSSPGQGLHLNNDQGNVPVFECGDRLLREYYNKQAVQPPIDYGSLLPSIINFDVAVEASVFIGFRFSSWSNSVWTTRYYLGRGDTNFEYTRERGIQPVGNGGLPPPHQNCDGIKDPGR